MPLIKRLRRWDGATAAKVTFGLDGEIVRALITKGLSQGLLGWGWEQEGPELLCRDEPRELLMA